MRTLLSTMIASFFILVLCQVRTSNAFPTGAPNSTCESMFPTGHGFPAQTTASPYTISVNPAFYRPGEALTVNISTNSGTPALKGILLLARRVLPSSTDRPIIGSWSVVGGSTDFQLRACSNGGQAVTHTNSNDKSSTLQFTWTAPDLNGDDIFITATFVQARDTFWVAETTSNIKAPGYCQIWGDHHYVTFDDKKYNFEGDCDYTLVRDCQKSSDYHLWSNNGRVRPSDRVSYLREVILELRGSTYSLIKGFHVRVNGIDVHVSVNLPYIDEQVRIYRDVTSMNLVTDFLRVSYDGQKSVGVYLSFNAGRTCGLCGSFDGDQSNDLMLPTGELARSATEFGNSWVVNPDMCDDVDIDVTDDCEDGVKSLAASDHLCYYLKDPFGPFESCLDYVNPDDYYDSCVYDVCLTGDDALCASLEQYARACKSKGGDPGRWRAQVPECPFDCPENTVYDPCFKGCPATCSSAANTLFCHTTCQETCRCEDGLVLDGGNCVDPSQCGCTLDNAVYLPSGGTWTNPDCTQHCMCEAGRAECEPFQCGENEECEIRNGVPSCL